MNEINITAEQLACSFPDYPCHKCRHWATCAISAPDGCAAWAKWFRDEWRKIYKCAKHMKDT